jgi:hypothetical protein
MLSAVVAMIERYLNVAIAVRIRVNFIEEAKQLAVERDRASGDLGRLVPDLSGVNQIGMNVRACAPTYA